jgi:hypothetical protein
MYLKKQYVFQKIICISKNNMYLKKQYVFQKIICILILYILILYNGSCDYYILHFVIYFNWSDNLFYTD